MLGAFWLDRVGVLDLRAVYLPETFAVPQALGGVLFGGGLVLAGLCPGTACVAAATGRRDGLAVMAGLVLGIVMFNLAFDSLDQVYAGTALGARHAARGAAAAGGRRGGARDRTGRRDVHDSGAAMRRLHR